MKSLIRLSGVISILFLVSFGYSADHALTATWTAATDGNTTGYKLYRTDKGYGTGGIDVLVDTIAHPTATCNFSITIPNGVSAILSFKVVGYNGTGDAPDSDTANILILFGVIKDSTPVIIR